jgi:ABC-type dipeptide/oligopeptide/nickel transport system permease subunit
LKKAQDFLYWSGIVYLTVLVLAAIFVPILGPDPLKLGTPFLPAGTPGHLLGTDDLGRDIFSRLMAGARASLVIGLSVQAISLVVGITFGTLGVLGPKWLRNPVMRLTDAMFAFPDILLAILIIAAKGPGFDAVILALTITSWPTVTRLVFTQMSSLKDREYVVAAKAMGASTTYVVLKHILPQLWGILLAVSMVDLAGTILAESTLSFLGIGIQSPNPSWGSMIDKARLNMNSYPILLLWPCLMLSMTIFALNFVGDGLRARLDPRSN